MLQALCVPVVSKASGRPEACGTMDTISRRRSGENCWRRARCSPRRSIILIRDAMALLELLLLLQSLGERGLLQQHRITTAAEKLWI